MDLINRQDKESVSKPELEQVEKQKVEYKLIDTILRTRGLNLYAYNPIKDIVFQVQVDRKKHAHTKIEDGKLILDDDRNYDKTLVDPRNEYFEALNIKSAEKRVEKFKKGLIKKIDNTKPIGDGIGFFKQIK